MIKKIMQLSEIQNFISFADKNNIGYNYNQTDYSIPVWRASFEISIFTANLREKLENTEFAYLLEN